MIIWRRPAERDRPKGETQRAVFLSRFQQGEIHLRLGEPAVARPHGEAALAIAQDGRARLPDQAESANDLTGVEALTRRIKDATP
jgi:hypothetical protein